MGAWGPGLYADDTTCDVRDSYVDGLRSGRSGEETDRAILDRYAELLEDREIACLVLFALADTGWRHGRLSDEVRDRAIALLELGGDLQAWQRDAPGDVPARTRVLRTLHARLLSPQPAPKPVRLSRPKPKLVRTSAPIGAAFLYALPSGYKTLLVLAGFIDLGKSVDPVFSVLRWHRKTMPTQDELEAAAAQTLPLPSGLGHQPHLGLLPDDRRTNVMSWLQDTGLRLGATLPFDTDGVAFMNPAGISAAIHACFGGRKV